MQDDATPKLSISVRSWSSAPTRAGGVRVGMLPLQSDEVLEVEDYEKAYQDPLTDLINWSLWITMAICGLGVVIVAAKIVMGYLDGNPQREAHSLLWVMGGCLLALSATSIASALVFT